MTNVTILTDDNGVNREYREVERKANVGERVKIIADAGVMLGEYRKGEVYIATKLDGSFLIYVDGKWGDGTELNLAHDDYVVLEPTDIIHVDGLRYREEKRKAKAGERILIVAAEDAEGLYANGSVQTIREVPEVFGCVLVTGHAQIIYHREYVVITPLDEPATNNITVNLTVNVASSSPSETLKAIVDSVQAELVKFVGSPNDEETRDEITEALTNKSRDGIVERAKADVAELEQSVGDRFYAFFEANYVINREKRTVVALIHDIPDGKVRLRGIAKCSPDDCFNVHVGKAIALRRALGLDVPSDYLNAPQPTEVRVGDVVKSTRAFGWNPEGRVSQVGGGKYISASEGLTFFTTEGKHVWRFKDNVKIIDDSRDQGTEVTAVA